MKILPDQFYAMEADDFWLMFAGWQDQLIYEQVITRNLAYIIHCSMVGKPLSIQKLWPIAGEKPVKASEDRALATLRKFKEQEALQKAADKLKKNA